MPKKKAALELHEKRPMDRYMPDPQFGLTPEQVKQYRDHGWDNRPVEAPSKTVGQIIKSNVCTYFNLIFAIISALLIFAGLFRELTFLPIIIANSLIGIFQELNAKRTLDKLTVLNAPKAKVLRAGQIKTVPSDKLVLDDIVLFSSGNQICADAIVVEGEVSVNESLLTGEPDEIIKQSGDLLMSGSFVVSGSCRARLDKVGEDSYISKLTLEAKASKEGEQSEMIRSLNKLVRIVGIIIIPIGLILFAQQFIFSDNSFPNSISSMVAAVIGMIPEGLYLLSSVTLAVSVVRLAAKKVLVHDMKCIETLARVDVLCVDKTGTITGNDMSVDSCIALDGFDEETMQPLEELLSDFAAAMSSDNITMAAMKEHFTTPSGAVPVSITSFSSAHKYSSATFSDISYVLGAPEFVLRDDYENYREKIEEQSNQGFRVLVFAEYYGRPDGGALTEDVCALCIVTLSNPIRKDAKETFSFFAQQGVEIKVISGDNPVTVSQVALNAGIINAENFIDASTLHTYEELANAVNHYTVFGRVTPSQKRDFVKALKEAGHTVAMTGDGVNDVLALKDADCSVAMASGSDAAAQASQLVLLESDFARMPDVVREGRQVVNNLERSGSLFLVKNIFSLLMSLITIFFGITYPLVPSQISLISLFTIGFPGFLLSQVPNTRLIKGKFITNIVLRALPGGLTDVIIVSALMFFGEAFAVTSTDISTAATILLSIVGFIILLHISKPHSWMTLGIWGLSVAGFILTLIFLPRLFSITSMSLRCVLLFVIFSVITEPLIRYLILLTNFLREKYVKFKSKER